MIGYRKEKESTSSRKKEAPEREAGRQGGGGERIGEMDLRHSPEPFWKRPKFVQTGAQRGYDARRGRPVLVDRAAAVDRETLRTSQRAIRLEPAPRPPPPPPSRQVQKEWIRRQDATLKSFLIPPGGLLPYAPPPGSSRATTAGTPLQHESLIKSHTKLLALTNHRHERCRGGGACLRCRNCEQSDSSG